MENTGVLVFNHKFIVNLGMDYSIYLRLVGHTLLPDGIKLEVFDFHNSLLNRSKYIHSAENRNTWCGSCKARVVSNLWKHYHFEFDNKFDELEFTGKFGINNMPIYRKRDAKG